MFTLNKRKCTTKPQGRITVQVVPVLGNTIFVDVNDSDTLKMLKNVLRRKMGRLTKHNMFVFNEQHMNCYGKPLREYGVQDGDKIHLNVNLRDGAKTKPKRAAYADDCSVVTVYYD